MKEQTIQEWKADGSSLFGSNPKKWKFICPSCGHVQSGEEFEKLENCNDWQDVYTKCIGRFVDGIEVELDKYHLIASLLTVAAACSQSDDPEDNKMGELIERNANALWSQLPKDYQHTVELEVYE